MKITVVCMMLTKSIELHDFSFNCFDLNSYSLNELIIVSRVDYIPAQSSFSSNIPYYTYNTYLKRCLRLSSYLLCHPSQCHGASFAETIHTYINYTYMYSIFSTSQRSSIHLLTYLVPSFDSIVNVVLAIPICLLCLACIHICTYL